MDYYQAIPGETKLNYTHNDYKTVVRLFDMSMRKLIEQINEYIAQAHFVSQARLK